MENAANMLIPVSWFLGAMGAVAIALSTVVGAFYKSLQAQIDQANRRNDRMHKRQAALERVIAAQRKDIERLAGGCGIAVCLWKHRPLIEPASTRDPLPTDAGQSHA